MPNRQKTIFAAIFAFLLIFPAVRIASTWRVFSQTADEGMHLAAGFQWLDSGRYLYDVGHPPLARVAFALPAYLSGATAGGKPPASSDPIAECVWVGNQLLYRGDRYEHNLAMARVGNLPFFFLAAVVLTLWARRLFGWPAALMALALFGALPPVLAHAGLTTTDMAATATILTALFCYARWLEKPSWPRALVTGAAIGLGLISKFSIVVYFPAGAAALTAAWWATGHARGARSRWRLTARQAAGALLAACLVIWAGYRFSIDTWNSAALKVPWDLPTPVVEKYQAVPGYEWVRQDIVNRYFRYAKEAERSSGKVGIDFVDWAKASGYPSPLAGRHGDTMKGAPPVSAPGMLEPARALMHRLDRRFGGPWKAAKQRAARELLLPAPEFLAGVDSLARHSAVGHPGFLLGEYRDTGWWYYFPLLLLLKTPIAFLLLAAGGMVWLAASSWRERRWETLGVALAAPLMLLPAMTSGINIGVRHVLPLYPLMAICAGVAVTQLWSETRWRAWARGGAIALLLWYFAATARAHPDYLPYFNELAGSHPEEIAVDSNFDWGQDLLRLCSYVNREKLPEIYISYWGSAEYQRCTTVGLDPPFGPVTGWLAVSEMHYKFGGAKNRGEDYEWLHRYQPVRRIGKSIRLYYIP
jgi:4-amino-4-deoxy-L-arabinose transferase-like glycosyltransferase